MNIKMNGAILVDKPENMTSHDVVHRLRKIFGEKSIGHAGTLDPLATGLLICLVGEATKLSQYVMDEEKSYLVGVRLGVRTDTGDITGKVLSKSDVASILPRQIEHAALSLVGELDLKVPDYSAVKVAGKKLYEYARAAEEVPAPTRKMTIKSVEVHSASQGLLQLTMLCGKGTYVRSWAEKLGELLGCGACVETLRRTATGTFSLDKSQNLEALQKAKEAGGTQALAAHLIPLGEVLSSWPSLRVFGRDQQLLKNGQISFGVRAQIRVFDFNYGVRLLDDTGGLLAIALKDPVQGVKLGRVFH